MVRIVTDSAANIPPALVDRYQIHVVPLKVQMGNESYREGIDLTQEEFFERLPNANPLPTTSQPSPADFEEIYSQIRANGDEIISIHISSKLSGTYSSAHAARSAGDEEAISLVDSESASAGIALLVLAAARMIEAGRSRAETVQRLETLKKELLLILTLDTLEYLKKGGRIGGAQAFLGGLLRVKPVIVLKDGRLEPGGRTRSRTKAIEQLVQMEAERFGNEPIWLATASAMAPDIDQLESLARSQLNVQEFIRCDIGPVVATHTGPGTLGIVAMPALAL